MIIQTVFIIVWVSIAIFVDIFFAARFGEEGTISAWFWKYSHEYPITAFAMGVLMGHLFWQAKQSVMDVILWPPDPNKKP
jgi:hypothetical protein